MKVLNLSTKKKKTAVVAGKVSESNLYNPRFDYQPLNRVTEDGRRLYDTPGGKLPSVTTVLEKTKPEEKKQALQEWRNRVGHAQAQAITTEAANRGTRMHTYLEHYVKNR
jgi:genome maintenance exonuclease 1